MTEGNVVLQLNGVSVDVDVIIKDAAIELNNNEADGKRQEETVVLSETIESSNTDKDASNEKKHDATVSQGSLNTSNGTDNVQCAPTEGDLKVDLTPETECDVKTEASDSSSIMSLETAASETAASETAASETAASETAASETAASETAALETTTSDAKENQSIGTEKSSGTSENVEEKLQSTSIEASTASEKHHHATTVHEESAVNTVASSANTANTAVAIIEDANSDSDTDAQSSTTQNGDDKKTNDEKSDEQTATGDEATKTGSPKKSPKKKSVNKKRKPRTRSQKKEFDYSELTKYNVNVSQRQRRYFVQIPRGRTVPVPGDDCEIFCSNIPINVLEEELIPLFERYGKIWELRLMMSVRNPKRNAGFAFVRFTSNTSANEATEKLNNYEIVPGKLLAVRLSQPNLSLFVGNIHRGLTREQIHEKISNRTSGKLIFFYLFFQLFSTDKYIQSFNRWLKCLPLFNPFLFFLGLVKTFVKSSLYEDTKNCGFCFLEYDSHSSALKAKRLLNKGNVWGRQLFVDWAQRRKQPEEAELSDSNTLFINYLLKETTHQQITDALSPFGEIEKVTKIKDYAFVSFTEHQAAVDAMNGADKAKLGHEAVEISLAMPKAMKTRTRTRYPSFSFRQPNRPFRRNQSFHQYNQAPGPSNKFYMRKQNRTRADSGTQAASTANEQTATQVDQKTTVPVVEPATIPVVEQTTIPVDGQTIIPEIDSTMVATNAETLVN